MSSWLYPEVVRGIGVLSPSVWKRIMEMLRSYESGVKDNEAISLQSLQQRIKNLEILRPFFFAKLLRARVLDYDIDSSTNLSNPNAYNYSWVECLPKTGDPECCALCLDTRDAVDGCCTSILTCGDGLIATPALQLQGNYQWEENPNHSSWGTTLPLGLDGNRHFTTDNTFSDPLADPCIFGDCDTPNVEPYTLPANNLLELFNTGDNAGGVDQTFGIGDFMMQAIGGGDTQRDKVLDGICDPPPCTQYEFPLKTTPIVIMFTTRESDGTFRYVFQAANAYDGTCAAC